MQAHACGWPGQTSILVPATIPFVSHQRRCSTGGQAEMQGVSQRRRFQVFHGDSWHARGVGRHLLQPA